MPRILHQHVRSKRAARKPHLLKALQGQAASSKTARPSAKAQNGTADKPQARRGRRQTKEGKQKVGGGTAALVTIQQESDERWKWDAYDKFGLKIATQEKLTDLIHCLEEVIKWHAQDISPDSAA